MAQKAASGSKKPTSKKPTAQTKSKLTTVKAVSSRGSKPAAASNKTKQRRLGQIGVSFPAAMVAEFIATFIFAGVFIAASGQPLYILLALAGVMLAVGGISGGYVNPALTIASWVTRRMKGLHAVGYIIAQVLGAMLALVVLNAFVNAAAPATSQMDVYNAAPSLYAAAAIPAGHEWLIFLSEFMGALIFGALVASATTGLVGLANRGSKALLSGFGMFLGLMLAGSAAALIGGTAILNPAVAISLEAINFSSVWPILIYVVGTSLGAIVGFLLSDMVRSGDSDEATA